MQGSNLTNKSKTHYFVVFLTRISGGSGIRHTVIPPLHIHSTDSHTDVPKECKSKHFKEHEVYALVVIICFQFFFLLFYFF